MGLDSPGPFSSAHQKVRADERKYLKWCFGREIPLTVRCTFRNGKSSMADLVIMVSPGPTWHQPRAVPFSTSRSCQTFGGETGAMSHEGVTVSG